jgi:hypothetical protein
MCYPYFKWIFAYVNMLIMAKIEENKEHLFVLYVLLNISKMFNLWVYIFQLTFLLVLLFIRSIVVLKKNLRSIWVHANIGRWAWSEKLEKFTNFILCWDKIKKQIQKRNNLKTKKLVNNLCSTLKIIWITFIWFVKFYLFKSSKYSLYLCSFNK